MLLLGASGCGALTASAPEYTAYRAVHVTPTVAGRLHAAAHYLRQYPEGVFHAEVSAWFGQVEPVFYEASADTVAGMDAYLAALPDGPHASAAAQRRDALAALRKREAGEGLVKVATAFEQRLAHAAQLREDVTATYSAWIARLLEFDGWGRSIDPMNEPLASAWAGAGASRPECDRRGCTKPVTVPYELEIDGELQPFVFKLEIALHVERGVVVDATVSGPDLALRLLEAHRASPAHGDSTEARIAELAWLIELTSGAAAKKLAPTHCAVPAKPPVVLSRQCGGLELDVIAASAAHPRDRVVIRATPKL
jgi:hypothetical protein